MKDKGAYLTGYLDFYNSVCCQLDLFSAVWWVLNGGEFELVVDVVFGILVVESKSSKSSKSLLHLFRFA